MLVQIHDRSLLLLSDVPVRIHLHATSAIVDVARSVFPPPHHWTMRASGVDAADVRFDLDPVPTSETQYRLRVNWHVDTHASISWGAP